MVLGNAVPMPLGMVQKMSLGLEVGIAQGYAVYVGTGGEPDLRAPGGTLEHQNASEIGAPWCLMH